ncbi:riboflavin synthase [Patescibacteria group bacterium]|nr:MAG: riboflavin synthase [Patescibacteria group bacterium]
MFGGIINEKGVVLDATLSSNIYKVRITKPKHWKLKNGQSISIDGICSTVSSCNAKFFEVQYVPETRARTTASLFKKGALVNLEHSITLNTLLDGHIISGHVDGVATVKVFKKNTHGVLILNIPSPLMKYIAPQGSVAINGASLTVQKSDRNSITLALIPETLARTNLHALRAGSKVNIEVDMLARYALRATLKTYAKKTLRKKKSAS